MPHDLNDPRLTAYALGELETQADRQAIESFLNENDEARRFVEEIRATAQLIEEQLRAESTVGLSQEQLRIIDEHLQPRHRRIPSHGFRIALAASVLILTITVVLRVYQQKPANLGVNFSVAVAPEPASTARAPAARPQSLVPELQVAIANPEPRNDMVAPARSAPGSRERISRFAYDFPERESAGYANPDLKAGTEIAPLGTSTTEFDTFGIDKPSPAPSISEPLIGKKLRGTEGVGGMGGLPAGAEPPELDMAKRRSEEMPGTAMPGEGRISTSPAIAVRAKSSSMMGILSDPRHQPDAKQTLAGLTAPADAPKPLPVDGFLGKLAEQPLQAASRRFDPTVGMLESGQPPETKLGRQFNRGAHAEKPAPENLRRLETTVPAVAQLDHAARGQTIHLAFKSVLEHPQATFGIDIDTASYALVRRTLKAQNRLPSPDSVRLEELVNAVHYNDAAPGDEAPFAVHAEIARCPWNADHRLARIALRGRDIPRERRPPGNLVFLIDTSGSMADPDKLPLLKQGMRMLVDQLGEGDRVAIVAYSAQARVVLNSTPSDRKLEILSALDQLQAQGSTNGAAGLEMAYAVASDPKHFLAEGTNRVILATDGDFNVGVTANGDLIDLIAQKARSGVYLTVLGLGSGNLQDDKLEGIADKGNGQYHYLDSADEARRVLVDELSGTLVTIARDVKIQLDFNPSRVAAYHQLGYENRALAPADLTDPAKDGGELGAGQNVTALFELVPPGPDTNHLADAPPALFKPATPARPEAKEAFLLKITYKDPRGDQLHFFQRPVIDEGHDYAAASSDFKFSAAVASFGLLLRDSPYKGSATYDSVIELAEASKGSDPRGERTEFIELVRKAKALKGTP